MRNDGGRTHSCEDIEEVRKKINRAAADSILEFAGKKLPVTPPDEDEPPDPQVVESYTPTPEVMAEAASDPNEEDAA